MAERMCRADLVVTVMTSLGGRWRHTAQQTLTTIRIRTELFWSEVFGVNNTARAQTVKTNAARQSVCL